jgi:hypothetical protein
VSAELNDRPGAIHPWHTADGLIEAFGDQAYHSGIRLMSMMILTTPEDQEYIDKLRGRIQELMQRGFHRRAAAV